MKSGLVDLRFRIEVEESGSVVHTLPLLGAFRVIE
jgi:hypothetical protein